MLPFLVLSPPVPATGRVFPSTGAVQTAYLQCIQEFFILRVVCSAMRADDK